MATIYQIKNTAGNKTVTILPQGVNGSNKSVADSDVNLIGQGATLWGESFNESFYRVVESFACPAKVSLPGVPQDENDLGTGLGINNPIPGQLWFNTDTNKVLVYSNTGAGSPANDLFQSINSVLASSSAPSAPILGDLWYDETLPQLKIYDGAAFTSIAERYLLLDGTAPMTGDLDAGGNAIINVADIIGGSPALGQQAANKNFVDQEINSLITSLTSGSPRLLDSIYVNVSGDTMSSTANLTFSGGGEILGLPATPSATGATSREYVDTTKVGKPGGAVAGNLMEFDSSENAVDSGISSLSVQAPVGSITMYAGVTNALGSPQDLTPSAPPGYLICDGQAVSRTAFANLFATIGEVFGVGDGSTTFNIPDLRGRSPMGTGPSSGDRGQSGSISFAQQLGDWKTQLTSINHLPAHNHGGGNHRHFIMRKGAGAFRAFITNLYDTFALHSNQGGTGAAEYALSASTSATPNAGVTDFAGGVTTQGASLAFDVNSPALGLTFIIKT